MHPDLCRLISYGKKTLGFHKVMMITNAFLLNEKRVQELNDAGLDDMQVSIDGVEPNDVTVKVLKPLRPKLEVLARVAKFRVTLNGVIGSVASKEALDVIAFAKDKGFRPRVCLIHSGDGQLRLTPEETQVYEQVKEALGKRFNEAGDYRSRLMTEGKASFKCRAGSRYLYVDEYGIVRWCSQQMPSFGIPLDQYGPEDLKRQFGTVKGCADMCTVGCVRTCSAYDEWRGQDQQPDPTAVTPQVFVQQLVRKVDKPASTPAES